MLPLLRARAPETAPPTSLPKPRVPFLDLHAVLTDNRLVGLWRMMSGYRLA